MPFITNVVESFHNFFSIQDYVTTVSSYQCRMLLKSMNLFRQFIAKTINLVHMFKSYNKMNGWSDGITDNQKR